MDALGPPVHFSSVAQSCLTLCDPMNCSMPGFPVHHQLPELTQTHELEGWKISLRSGPQGPPAVGLCQGHTPSGLQNSKFAAESRGEVTLAAAQAFFAFFRRLLLWEDINFSRIRKRAFGTLQHRHREVPQSCLTLCESMDLSLPGSAIHGILQVRILGCYFLLQGIFLNQGSNPGLPHCRQTLQPLSHQGIPTLQHICQQFGKSCAVYTRTSLTLPLLGNFGSNLGKFGSNLGNFGANLENFDFNWGSSPCEGQFLL